MRLERKRIKLISILFVLSLSVESQKIPPATKILFTGDVMFEWNVRETLIHNPPEFIVSELKPLFSEADLRIVNLETPILSDDFKYMESMAQDKAYVFRGLSSDISLLKYLGIDLALLGNNHTMDFGKEGLLSTVKNLEKSNIGWVGAGINKDQAYSPYYYSHSESDFLIFSASEYGTNDSFADEKNSGVARLNVKELILSLLKENNPERNNVRVPIATLHWGLEYSPTPEKNQKNIAHSLIDAGFSAVMGHHPHISQGIEKYKNGIIFYSLGNFIFGSKNQLLNHNLVTILHYEAGKLKMAEIIPVFGKFQELDGFYIYPLQGEEAKAYLQELYVQCKQLDTELEIIQERGYIKFEREN